MLNPGSIELYSYYDYSQKYIHARNACSYIEYSLLSKLNAPFVSALHWSSSGQHLANINVILI